ncbi:hypothetical protein A2W32_04295 [candidate division WWE3 bacterium RBG_16_37_10]|uniref:DUF5667 domain-containing protein n=1 Tax=candidate division WWE3 bacterium RBG_16_37_10 TaxID=1802610 RepID=A0A1F4UWQ6_UNCKA|nr:MAG: hypothetical protein A2W32_04295 [candidate division WWE3 bacterium RBG_16_37_10]
MAKPKIFAFLVISATLFTTISYQAHAVESTSTNTKNPNILPNITKFSDIKDNLKNNFQNRIAKRCEIITNNIDNRINAYNNKKNAHIKRYDNLKNLIPKIIKNLEEKGYDVTQLKSALSEFDAKIIKYTADYKAFIDALKNTQNFACGESEGDFLNALEDAKTALQTVMLDTRDIHYYYQNVFKKLISDLREQNPLRSQDNL